MYSLFVKISVVLLTVVCAAHCRVVDFNSRILGGEPAVDVETKDGAVIIKNRNQYPYVAEIDYFDELWCGGALVRDNAVLTAAHCLEDIHFEHLKVRVGGTFLRDTGSLSNDVQWSGVRRYITHPRHRDEATSDSDIGIIWTTDHFKRNPSVGPIKLTKSKEFFEGEDTIILGWGETEKSGHSNILLKATVSVTRHSYCRKLYGERLTKNMICVEKSRSGVTICSADSGGPLVLRSANNPKTDVLIGLASFGNDTSDGKCDVTVPSVFTKVGAYTKWIESKLDEDDIQNATEQT